MPGWAEASSAKLRHIYLTWQRDPSHTITVNIHGLRTPEELFVYYDSKPHYSKIHQYCNKSGGHGETFRCLKDNRRLYHIELTNLKPGITYYFTVGDHFRSYGNELSFRTIPDDDSPMLFVEGGDWENSLSAEALAKKAASLNPYAAWLGGDYPSHVNGPADFDKWDYWLDVYERNMITPEKNLIPMVMAIGNHEVIGGFDRSRKQAPFFFHYFKQGGGDKSYFSLPFGERIRLFVLDSGHTCSHSGEQKEWLENSLIEAANVPITVALYHVPLFPSVRFADQGLAYRFMRNLIMFCTGRNNVPQLFSRSSYEGRKNWLPLFDIYGLTVAFEHHDQTLKRTKRLRNNSFDPSGTLYLGDGGWGSEKQYPPIQNYFHSYFAQVLGKEYFFWVVQFEGDKITYVALTASGKELDRFSQQITS